MNPLRFIHKDDIIYKLDGKQLPMSAFKEQDIPISTVLLAGNAKNLEQAKAFTRAYVIPAVHRELESCLQEDGVPTDSWNCHLVYSFYDALYPKLEAQYAQQGESGAQERRGIIANHVNAALDAITLEEIRKARRRETRRKSANPWGVALEDILEGEISKNARFANEKAIQAAFTRLPEWMQVITHEYGAYVTTTADAETFLQAGGVSKGDSYSIFGPFFMFIHPLLAETEPMLNRAVREEMLHEIQRRLDILLSIEDEKNEVVERQWASAARDLIKKIDADPQHPALALIEKSDPKGGSLMAEHTKNSPEIRAGELLADFFDAEIYVRKNEGKTKEETAELLKERFGEEVCVAAHAYAKRWISKAAAILEKHIGPQKAAQYRAKWEEDPFCHRVTLTQLPHYKLETGPDVPGH